MQYNGFYRVYISSAIEKHFPGPKALVFAQINCILSIFTMDPPLLEAAEQLQIGSGLKRPLLQRP